MKKDGKKKSNHVFRYLLFPALSFSSLVIGEIGGVVYGKVCIKGVIVCGVEDAWIWKSGLFAFFSFQESELVI